MNLKLFNKTISLMPAVVIILTLGFMATSLTSYFISRSSLRSEITSNSLPLTSDNIYSEIQRDLLQPVFISSLMAHDTFVRDWVIYGEKNEKEISRYLNEIKQKYGTVTTFFVSAKTENYYHSEGILKKISPLEARDVWYYRVKNMTADYEINIDNDLANQDTMTIFINYKVMDYNSNFIGVTGVGLTVKAVKKLITLYQEKYNRNIFFIDGDGKITLRSSFFTGPETSIQEIEGIEKLAPEILKSKGATYTYKRENKRYYLNTRYIQEFNWYLLVEENDENAARLLLRTLIINIIISLLITLVIFILLRIQIRSYQGKLERLAITDKLTGLYNRQAFDGIMEHALKEKKRSKVEMALLMLDLDHFKNVNDNYGHLSGDSVLVQSGERIKSVIRESDALCRWGGEEFFILMKGCGSKEAMAMAEKIRIAFDEKPFSVEGVEIVQTASLGCTVITDEDTHETAVERSDRALYSAKEAGRNRIALA